VSGFLISRYSRNENLKYFFEKELIMNSTTAEKGAVLTSQNGIEPIKLLKRIGSTTVEITVHFSKEGSRKSETIADITRRLLEREVAKIA
jgi:hypothetical protein